MIKVTKEEIKKYVRDFVNIDNVSDLFNCGFYIHSSKLCSFYNLVGQAHDSLYLDSTYVVYVTDLIEDYFSNQDLKFNLSDLDRIFYERINCMLEEFNY